MSDEKPANSGSGMSRGLKLLLALSLALNLAVAGVVAGTALKFHRDGDRALSVRDASFGPFTEALTREQRRALLAGMSDRGVALRQARNDLRRDIDALIATLRQEPFDVEAFRSQILEQGGRIEARAREGRLALTDLVATMTVDERAAFAERLARSMTERRRVRD